MSRQYARASPASGPALGLESAHRIDHDAKPVLEWCISTVVGHYDARGNVHPRKARPEQKIDAAVGLIMAIARCMAAQPKRSGGQARPLR